MVLYNLCFIRHQQVICKAALKSYMQV